jgi:hypothetical protein
MTLVAKGLVLAPPPIVGLDFPEVLEGRVLLRRSALTLRDANDELDRLAR